MFGASEQLVDSVVAGANGRVYVIGSSQGTSDWGGAEPLVAVGAGFDVVIAAYDP